MVFDEKTKNCEEKYDEKNQDKESHTNLWVFIITLLIIIIVGIEIAF